MFGASLKELRKKDFREGREEGFGEGEREGMNKGVAEFVGRLKNRGYSVEQIADMLNLSPDEAREYLDAK